MVTIRSVRTHLNAFLLLAALAAAVPVSLAQSYYGAVRGTVMDPNGATVAGAKVTLTDQATNVLRSTLSNDAGAYTFSSVDPATYTLSAESPGFKKVDWKNVVVATQQSVVADLKLELGSVSESVMVTDEVPLIESANASNGQVLNNQKMTDLPNLGRNPFLLSKLATNVVPAGDPRFNRFQDQSGSSQITIAGGPVRGNNYLIDGIPITDSVNRAVIIPSIEATQEMKLQTGTYDSEMGRTGGGVFNVFMKSGTNDVHGSLFGYTRQTDWLANNFFYNRSGIARPDTPFYNWGGSLGGPVEIPKIYNGKNKTFFWIATESYRQKSPLSSDFYVPTALERTGDFSKSTVTIFDPLSTHACTTADKCPAGVTTARSPFPGNVIPTNRLNSTGLLVASYFPLPTRSAATGSPNFTGVDTLSDRADEYTAKLDHDFTSWLRMSASYLHYKSREPGGNPLETLPGNGSYLLYRKVDATQVNGTMTPNATTVVAIRYGFNRFPNLTLPNNLGSFAPSQLGWPGSLVSGLQYQYFPEFDFQNAASMSNISPSQSTFYSRNLLGSVSKFMGRHSLKFGADYRSINVDFFDGTYTSGDFAIDNAFTRQFPSKPTSGTGSDIADLLLGYPSAGQINTSTKLYTNVHYYALYVQDDIRWSSKLTLNVGLRYEYETGVGEANNHYVVGFNKTAVNPIASNVTGITPLGAIMYAGVNGNPARCCNAQANKFGPRIGAAYQLNDKTTLRAGWGIFYAPTRFADDASLALGYTQATPYVATNDGFVTPANNLSNPFPNGLLTPVGNAKAGLTGIGSSFNYLDQNRRSGIVYQYSFDIQRELPGKIAAEVGYIGSLSHHLQPSSTGTGAVDINQVPDQYLSMGSALLTSVANPFYGNGGSGVIGGKTVTQAQLLRPFPEFGNIGALTDASHARYDSLVVKAQKRMSAGVTFLSTFTWSKNMDASWATGNNLNSNVAYAQDYYNLANEYSLAIVDTPLRFTTSATYELPFGKGKMLLSGNKWLDYAVGGWQVNLTSVYQSGFPLAISQLNLNSVIGAQTQRPNATGVSPSMPGSIEDRLNNYINKAAFTDAPQFTFGNVARTIPYRGPGMKNWDASLFKDFSIFERVKAQFRAEALNVFNSPQFRSPVANVDSSSFGHITSQANFPRLLQLGARFYF